MRLSHLRLKGFPAFPDEVSIDLDALGDARLVAVCGSNGAGKSTLLELFPAALYREGPTRGSLAKLATSRDAMVEATVVNGARYTIRQLVDAVSGKGETVILDESGAPVLDSSKVRDADRWIASHLPAPGVLYASTFAAQGSAGFLDLSPAQRKSVLLKILGIEHLERLAEAAREKAREAKGRLATAEARLADERTRGSDPAGALGRLQGARDRATDVDALVAAARLALSEAEAAAASEAEAMRAWERKLAELGELKQREGEVSWKADEQKALIAKLEERIANNQGVIARAEEINAAVARDADLANSRMVAAAFIAERKAMLDGAQAAVRQAEADERKAQADLAAANGRIDALRRILADDGKVIEAQANLPIQQNLLAQAEESLADVEARLEEARGKRVAGAEDRIKGLRGGLQLIVDGDQTPVATADRVLFADMEAVTAAAEIPKLVTTLEAQRAGVVYEVRKLSDVIATYERIAARAPEMERAKADEGAIALEIISAERAVPAAATVLEAARRTVENLTGEIAQHEGRVNEIAAERAQLAPTVKLAEPLAQAQARLEELAPQVEAARTAMASLTQEAEGLRTKAAEVDPGDAPKAPDLDHARARVTTAETAAREAHSAVALAERQLEEARASAARTVELETDRNAESDEAADWTRLSDDLGKGGIQALEIDAAGPELTDLANDLLHSAFGTRFTIQIDSTRTAADGRELEACEVTVLDTEKGREGPAETFSGGERVVIGEAVALALSMLACKRAGIERPTLVRDESGAALDAGNGRAYLSMLRRAVDLIGADRCLFVSHTPELQELADVRLHVEAGRVEVR